MMKSNLFNQEAMDNLSTPEQMDRQVRVISPGSWLLFVAVIIGVIAALLWVCIGIISNGTDYAGVIFDHNNVIRVSAKESGVLQDVLADEGSRVSEGDILAVIANEELLGKIKILREEQRNYKAEDEDYIRLENEIIDCNNKMMLRSTADGMVQRIEISGKAVEAGETVATVVPESTYSYEEVYVYVPKEEAGALEIGMEAQITPSFVTREEYGYMEGVISAISPNIVTENYILKHMGTMDYVESIMPSSKCVEVTIQLNVNLDGGYVWSNLKGEQLSVHSGDQCAVRILKKEYHPYELIVER